MSASIWDPAGTVVPTANADNTLKKQKFVATADQVTFTLTTFTYQPASDSLLVEVNGVGQYITQDYVETSSSVVTLVTPSEVGDQVVIRGYVGGTAAVAATVSATSAAASATSAAASLAAITALSLPALTLSPVGAVLYASSTSVIGALADVAVGAVMVSGGVGVAPAYSTSPTIDLAHASALPLTTTAISSLTTTNIAALQSAQIPALVATGGTGVTSTSQIASVNALMFGGLTTSQVAQLQTTSTQGLSAALFAGLNTTQIATLQTTTPQALSAQLLAGLTTTQVAALASTATLGASLPLIMAPIVVSGAATGTIEPPFDSTYDYLEIVITALSPATDQIGLHARMKVGGSVDTGANYDYFQDQSYSGGSTFAGNSAHGATSISIVPDGYLGNAAEKSASFKICIWNPSSTTLQKHITWEGVNDHYATNYVVAMRGYGINYATTALTAIQLYASSGNISFTAYVYGRKKA